MCVSKSLCSDLVLSWLSEFTGNSFSYAFNFSKVGKFVPFGEGCSFFHLSNAFLVILESHLIYFILGLPNHSPIIKCHFEGKAYGWELLCFRNL